MGFLRRYLWFRRLKLDLIRYFYSCLIDNNAALFFGLVVYPKLLMGRDVFRITDDENQEIFISPSDSELSFKIIGRIMVFGCSFTDIVKGIDQTVCFEYVREGLRHRISIDPNDQTYTVKNIETGEETPNAVLFNTFCF